MWLFAEILTTSQRLMKTIVKPAREGFKAAHSKTPALQDRNPTGSSVLPGFAQGRWEARREGEGGGGCLPGGSETPIVLEGCYHVHKPLGSSVDLTK